MTDSIRSMQIVNMEDNIFRIQNGDEIEEYPLIAMFNMAYKTYAVILVEETSETLVFRINNNDEVECIKDKKEFELINSFWNKLINDISEGEIKEDGITTINF